MENLLAAIFVRTIKSCSFINQFRITGTAFTRNLYIFKFFIRSRRNNTDDFRNDFTALNDNYMAPDFEFKRINEICIYKGCPFYCSTVKFNRIKNSNRSIGCTSFTPFNITKNRNGFFKAELECNLSFRPVAACIFVIYFALFNNKAIDIIIKVLADFHHLFAVSNYIISRMYYFEGNNIKAIRLQELKLAFFILKRLFSICSPDIINDEAEVFAAFPILSFHKSIGSIAAISFIRI